MFCSESVQSTILITPYTHTHALYISIYLVITTLQSGLRPSSHLTYVMSVNFINEWLDLNFKVYSKRQIFGKLFKAISIYSHSFCQKSAERKSPKKYFFKFRELRTFDFRIFLLCWCVCVIYVIMSAILDCQFAFDR